MINKTILCIFLTSAVNAVIDFDASMQLDKHTYKRLPMIDNLLGIARELYEKHNFDNIHQSQELIPNIIHHIWFGRPLSQEDKALRATWEKHHPDWRFVLWTDREENDSRGAVVCSWQELENALNYTDERYIVVNIERLKFGNKRFFDASHNYAEKSDILRYEIVYRLGGVYIDCDFECLKPLDMLHKCYDFYTGLQPLDTNYVQLGAALFGAKPGHPILRNAIDTIARDRIYGPIILRSGPIHFSRAFIACAGKDESKDIAFPASFFYPCGYNQKGHDRQEWLKQEAFAVHHWAGSWLVPEAFER